MKRCWKQLWWQPFWKRCAAARSLPLQFLLRLFHRTRPGSRVNCLPEQFDLIPPATLEECRLDGARIFLFSNQRLAVRSSPNSLEDLRAALEGPPGSREAAVRNMIQQPPAFDLESYLEALDSVLSRGATLGHAIELRRAGEDRPAATLLLTAQTPSVEMNHRRHQQTGGICSAASPQLSIGWDSGGSDLA